MYAKGRVLSCPWQRLSTLRIKLSLPYIMLESFIHACTPLFLPPFNHYTWLNGEVGGGWCNTTMCVHIRAKVKFDV